MPTNLTLPQLHVANADFVTANLLVGGDLDYHRPKARRQLAELVDAGVTHIVDVRIEADSSTLVAALAPQVTYLHLGIDDAGQRIGSRWFDVAVEFVQAALRDDHARVLTHCHMGINRGPSLGFAVLLAQGWDPIDALDAIRGARPIAYVDYAGDALRWHHSRSGGSAADLRRDLARVAQWRQDNAMDVSAVIRGIRRSETQSTTGGQKLSQVTPNVEVVVTEAAEIEVERMSSIPLESDQHSARDGLDLYTTDLGLLLHVEGCEYTGPVAIREPTATERRDRSICDRCQRELSGAGRQCFGRDLEAAMRFYGTHVEAQASIREILTRIDHDLLWVPPSKTYIAVRWQGKAAAWVHHGHIGISGGQRVELPGYRERSRTLGAPGRPRFGQQCPKGHGGMSLTGICDWCEE